MKLSKASLIKNYYHSEFHLDKPKDYCGVFGVAGVSDALQTLYKGLFALQHRGQDSCGVVVLDKDSHFSIHKGMGLVDQVFLNIKPENFIGNMGLGHVRYPTCGKPNPQNIQPFVSSCIKDLAVAHNGQISNCIQERIRLNKEGIGFSSTSDSELIVKRFENSSKLSDELDKIIINTFKDLEPSYSVVLMYGSNLIAVRDPLGVKPLYYGKLKDAVIFSSESVAISAVGGTIVGEVPAGYAIIANNTGFSSLEFIKFGKFEDTFEKDENLSKCIFEGIYFMSPSSIFPGSTKPVSQIRQDFGKYLWEENKSFISDSNVVIPVPDSGIQSALGFSTASKIPFDFGLLRNQYAGRSFINPSQKSRIDAIRRKFSVVKSVIEGKDIILIDDSIVRGNTTRNLIKFLRDEGNPKSIRVLISSPPYCYGCYLGVDTCNEDDLIARTNTIEQIRVAIGADYLNYLSIQGLLKSSSNVPIKPNTKCGFCTYCFDGNKVV